MSLRFLFLGRMLALIGISLLLTAVFLSPRPQKAYALQAMPPTNWSFYITSSSTSAAYNLGCNQGHADNTHGTNSAVVLDFGEQTSTGASGFGANLSYQQIEAIAEEFSHGYWVCTGSDIAATLSLGIGTSNYTNSLVTYGAGQSWANAVIAVNTFNQKNGYSAQVVMHGANDIEPGWNSPSASESWVNGFASIGGLYYDYGSADACSTSNANNSYCTNGWYQYDVWYVSWGALPAIPTPEIYNSTLAWQWQKISLYGALSHGGHINILAPWDENANDYNAAQAWDALWNDLNSDSRTAQNFQYSMEIHWQ